MTNEFKKVKNDNETRYVLETATAGATSAGSVAGVTGSVGKVQKRGGILAQEKKETPKPRNFVAKNAKMGGAGQHKDKKKAAKQGDVKHKNKEMAEGVAETVPMRTAQKVLNHYGADYFGTTFNKLYFYKNRKQFSIGLIRNDDLADAGSVNLSDLNNMVRKLRDMRNPMPYKEGVAEGVAEGERTMSRAAKGNEKYGKDGMKALAKAGRDGASEKKLDAIRDKHDNYNEDSDPCWKDYKQIGMKKKGGKSVPNCVPKESLAEGFNHEYDDEAGMAQSNLLTTARAVMGLLKTIKDRDNLPEWGQEKIAKAEMMLVSVWDYLQSQKEMGNDPQQGVAEGGGPAYIDNMMNQYKSGIGQATAGKPARGVDAKGRTQRQWMDLVKAKFPDAKVMQSKMIDGPVQAILPDGRKLSWNKVEQGVAEGEYYDKWKAGQDARDEKRSDMFNIVQQRGTDRANMMSRHSHDNRERSHQRHQDYLDKLHTDRMSKPALGSGGGFSGGGGGDDERTHQAQQRMARDEYRTQQRKDDDEDTRKTFDMMRDRLNRMQYANQRNVDPEQIARLNAIKYEPSKTEEGADGDTLTPNWAKYVLDQVYNSNGDITMTDLFDEGIPGLRTMFIDVAQELNLDPDEDFTEVESEVLDRLENMTSGHDEVNDSYMESLSASLASVLQEKAPPGDKYERMVKHIKKGYSKDGKISDKEKSIAYATAWKSKNKSKK